MPGSFQARVCRDVVEHIHKLLIALPKYLREIELLLDHLRPGGRLKHEARGALRHGGQLEKVARHDDLDAAKRLHRLPNVACHALELLKQLGIDHRDLVNHKHTGLFPTRHGIAVPTHIATQLLHCPRSDAHATEAVQRDTADIARGNARRGSDGNGAGRLAVLGVQVVDHLAKQIRLSGASRPREKHILAVLHGRLQHTLLLRREKYASNRALLWRRRHG